MRAGMKRTGMRGRVLVVSAGLALGVCGVGALMAMAPQQAQSEKRAGRPGERVTSDLFEVSKSDFDITTTATGDLRARNQIEIRNPIDSETQIVEIIPEGSMVKLGDVLVKLNAEPIETRVDEESLQLESARAAHVEAEQAFQIQISENESSKRQAELKVALAELDLAQWLRGEVESKRQELDHAVERTQKDADRLKEKLDKSKALFAKGFYAQDQLKQDELAYEQAEAALDKAKLDKTVYWDFQHPKDEKKKKSDLEEARAELERSLRQNQSKLASKEADLNNKRQSLQIRQQKHDKAKEQLAGATIKAPSEGLVVYGSSIEQSRWGGDEGPMQVGKKVFPNELLVVLPDTSEMIAAVKVHESLAARIRPGQAASVKVDAAGGRVFSGRVESIGILAEQTSRWMDPNLREYTVRIAIDIPKETTHAPSESDGPEGPALAMAQQQVASDASPAAAPAAAKAKNKGPDHGLKPSMRCEAEIFLGTVKDAITVPIQSVFSDGLVRYVYVPDGTKFTKRLVQVGQRSDRYAEIRTGVSPGERVLIRKPEPAEVIAKNFDEKELASVGLKTNEQGVIVPIDGGMRGGPGRGGRPSGAAGAGGGGGAPQGRPPTDPAKK